MTPILIFILLGTVSSVYSQGLHSVFLAIENYLETVGLKYRDECIKESGVDVAVVEQLEKSAVMANDDKLKCYIQCHLQKANAVDEKGVVNIDAVKSVLKATNQDFLDMVQSDCKLPKHPHLCEAAYQSALCVFNILVSHHHIH